MSKRGKWCRPMLMAVVLAVLLAPPRANAPHSFDKPGKARFLEALLARMSVTEKAGQLRMRFVGKEANPQDALDAAKAGQIGAMFAGTSVPRARMREMQQAASQLSRLGIPLFFAADVVHGHRTIFPIGLGLASTWDMQAISTSARVAAREASADGLDMTFAPMVDVTRDPRWGRMSESSGEDTYLTASIAATTVRALQGPALGSADSLMACVKHFAAYGAVEGGRDYNSTDLSPQRLYQDVLPPYQAAVDAGAGAIMTALTTLNGTPATANSWLLRKILRQKWQFNGLVISDHGAVAELMAHGVASDGRAAAQAALGAGTQMSMSDQFFGEALPLLVEQGAVPMQILDDAVRQVLSTKYDLGLFKDPYLRLGKPEEDPSDPHAEQRLHRAEARDVARRSLVLLKNRENVLPLARRGTLALIGPLADNPVDILGSWHGSGQPQQAISLYHGLKHALGPDATLLYAKGANIEDNRQALRLLADNQQTFDPRTPSAMLAEATAIAQRSDVVIVALGEARGMSHEGASKADLNLPLQQRQLLRALKQTGKPLVLVLMNGRPLTVVEESELADAVLETWFSGTEGGNAIADVLFGDYNPSGKLPVTFPRSVGQVPLYYNHLNTGRPYDPANPMPYRSRYFDIDGAPLYPFGFGLSYSRFALSAPRLTRRQLRPGQVMHARVEVRNESSRSGETVVQLYLRDISASLSRPLMELKGFHKVMLAPGESRTVTFVINEAMLAFHDHDLRLRAEPGEFDIMVGLDSQNLQHARFELLPATE